MSSFNKISICGYLGRDPELRYTNAGDPVCDFSVATTERRKDKAGEVQEQTTWFKVACFGKMAENAHQYLKKGSRVYVEGPLTRQDWTDQEGKLQITLAVRGSDLKFLDPVGEQEGSPKAQTTAAASGSGKGSASVLPDDDILF